jgi:hypothetical protein
MFSKQECIFAKSNREKYYSIDFTAKLNKK